MVFHFKALFEVNGFGPCAKAHQILHATGKLNIFSVQYLFLHLDPYQMIEQFELITF